MRYQLKLTRLFSHLQYQKNSGYEVHTLDTGGHMVCFVCVQFLGESAQFYP